MGSIKVQQCKSEQKTENSEQQLRALFLACFAKVLIRHAMPRPKSKAKRPKDQSEATQRPKRSDPNLIHNCNLHHIGLQSRLKWH